jgi:hypothetical protein
VKEKFLNAAEVVDAWRVIPRAIMIGYGWIIYNVTEWFLLLPDPTGTQMGFASTIWGAAGILTGWYFSTGRKWDGSNQHFFVKTPEYGSYHGPGPIHQPPPSYHFHDRPYKGGYGDSEMRG